MLTVVGIENAHPFAMAELVDCVANWKVIRKIERENENQPLDVRHQTTIVANILPPKEPATPEHKKDKILVVAMKDIKVSNYVLVHTPTHGTRGLKNLALDRALAFVDGLFEIGRSLRDTKPKDAGTLREAVYNWAGHLHPQKTVDYAYTVRVPSMMRSISHAYAEWQEQYQKHKIRPRDSEVIAVVQRWNVKSFLPAWHLLPYKQRYAIIDAALESRYQHGGHRLSAFRDGTAHGILTVLRGYPDEYFYLEAQLYLKSVPLCFEFDLADRRSAYQLLYRGNFDPFKLYTKFRVGILNVQAIRLSAMTELVSVLIKDPDLRGAFTNIECRPVFTPP
jgi:hypothetical protein